VIAAIAWTLEEVEAIVADYLDMLSQELAGTAYNKTAHRRALAEKLSARSDGSIERKHQNISAVMIELGCPYIPGYKPLANYQALLFEVVSDRLTLDKILDRVVMGVAEQEVAQPAAVELRSLLEQPPTLAVAEPKTPYQLPRTAFRRDYLAREARNRSLGAAGEALAVAYERFRLHEAGRRKLSDRVEHVSQTRGDGLGYDILSFDLDGRERFIEVKTTAFGKETPFFITRSEVDFSEATADQFHLYRLFEFRRQPRLFTLHGPVGRNCVLDPAAFVARFG
jgi:hypothetical protein